MHNPTIRLCPASHSILLVLVYVCVCACVCVCVCVCVSAFVAIPCNRSGTNSVWLLVLLVVSRIGKMNFHCPRLRPRIRSCKPGWNVPVGVSSPILHTLAESLVLPHGHLSFFPLCTTTVSTYTINRHRFSPKFIRSRNCVPMTFTAESPPAQDQWFSR